MIDDMTMSNLGRQAAQECLGFGVRRAARAVGRMYDDALAPLGIKGTQFSLLNATYLMQQASIGQLADALVMDRTTLSRNLRPLQQAGLVESQRGEDRRNRYIRLTGKGRTLLGEALPIWSQTHARLVSLLGKTQARRLSNELAELTRASREG